MRGGSTAPTTHTNPHRWAVSTIPYRGLTLGNQLFPISVPFYGYLRFAAKNDRAWIVETILEEGANSREPVYPDTRYKSLDIYRL